MAYQRNQIWAPVFIHTRRFFNPATFLLGGTVVSPALSYNHHRDTHVPSHYTQSATYTCLGSCSAKPPPPVQWKLPRGGTDKLTA